VFLKSLTLKGFKSFADPSTLLLEPGVTVVVGPNGSGKSNVVDAVAWVLGAQGPRTVRSSKMEDVIFAGSADRPALGRAEVSLTIDNRTGKLPGGLAEITITRTLFRSGESEYALNGQPCRLLDVQELLSDSGVGRQQHVIVSQGQLGAILDSRPEDRRAVIEEAAGVLKFRRRRERAERRLAATEENLDRLGDLVREVRRQIRPLERQAASARSHASLAEELRALRLYLIGRELAGLDGRRDAATNQRGRLVESEGALVASIAELDASAEATAADLATQREEDLVVALTRVQGLSERCRGLTGVVAERRRSIGRALEASADTDVVSTLEADAARLSAELDATTHDDAELAPQAEEVRAAEHALARDVAAHEASFADLAGQRAAEEARQAMQAMMERLKLTVNEAKTRVCHLPEDSFDFLGYTIGRCWSAKTGRAYLGTRPSRQSLKRLCREISEQTRRRTQLLEPDQQVAQLNRKLLGWANYFHLGPVSKAYRSVDRHAASRLRQWLRGKHKLKGRGIARYPDSYLYEKLGLIRLSQRTCLLPWAKA